MELEEEKASLNYDCNYNLFLAKRLIADMRHMRDRQRVIKWLRYLMSSNKSIQEMQLRNDFMYYLVLHLQEGTLRPPFDAEPPAVGSLVDIAGLIPGRIDNTENPEEIIASLEEPGGDNPMVMKMSPDGGAFLAAQPVPHQGSFCYLAITTKKDEIR
ncbi:uncharacterized protein LOC105689668 [Athalia rosae]|uniref:uncharacterized protein LOC105689668 n=1 Tax=Athalia rosae TaxID=37344 RepID=UPI000624F6E1|nr:uncharacterized protein LOC105689668 [Athalia rosae]